MSLLCIYLTTISRLKTLTCTNWYHMPWKTRLVIAICLGSNGKYIQLYPRRVFYWRSPSDLGLMVLLKKKLLPILQNSSLISSHFTINETSVLISLLLKSSQESTCRTAPPPTDFVKLGQQMKVMMNRLVSCLIHNPIGVSLFRLLYIKIRKRLIVLFHFYCSLLLFKLFSTR